mmetsp:Transcript_30551/g.55800  ORF Transcript_30551/g.55800 Transcript_30551/m.55800 type:complete len:286 (+) Transcript_30551:119-976(+)
MEGRTRVGKELSGNIHLPVQYSNDYSYDQHQWSWSCAVTNARGRPRQNSYSAQAVEYAWKHSSVKANRRAQPGTGTDESRNEKSRPWRGAYRHSGFHLQSATHSEHRRGYGALQTPKPSRKHRGEEREHAEPEARTRQSRQKDASETVQRDPTLWLNCQHCRNGCCNGEPCDHYLKWQCKARHNCRFCHSVRGGFLRAPASLKLQVFADDESEDEDKRGLMYLYGSSTELTVQEVMAAIGFPGTEYHYYNLATRKELDMQVPLMKLRSADEEVLKVLAYHPWHDA